jgi:Fur family peroxide stress response transcriptional regulator
MKNQQLITKLREKGIKITPQRTAICQLILSSKDHPSAEQIYREIKKGFPTISPATVYQTLHLLTKIGLIQEMGFNNGISRYEPNTSPHINIICQKCGAISDYEAASIKEMWFKIVEELGIKPTGQRLEIFRYCDKCQKLSTRGDENDR